ncbi:hypothetical protein JCM5350_004488 [Sporobolomyces pararoseus]
MPAPHLPPELLEDVFSQLSSSKSALYHLSLSCRTFYHLCKPFMYSHITITTGEQREKLKEVRKEDAQLVKKLVIKGRRISSAAVQMNGRDNSIGSGIIEDLFTGELLDISGSFFPSNPPIRRVPSLQQLSSLTVIEVLHLSHLYENVNKLPDPDALELRAASNLVELSVLSHLRGGALWECILEDEQLCPSLVRLGSYSVWSFEPYYNPHSPTSYTPKYVGESGDYQLSVTFLFRDSLGERLKIAVAAWVGHEEPGENSPVCKIWSWDNYLRTLHWMSWRCAHVHLDSFALAQSPYKVPCRQMLACFQSNPNKIPSFLSIPFSRSDFNSDTLSVFSSIGDLGVELRFTLDEEEEDSISLIPQSFVKFVEKQEKLK